MDYTIDLYRVLTIAYGLWIMDYGLWIMDYGLWIMFQIIPELNCLEQVTALYHIFDGLFYG